MLYRFARFSIESSASGSKLVFDEPDFLDEVPVLRDRGTELAGVSFRLSSTAELVGVFFLLPAAAEPSACDSSAPGGFLPDTFSTQSEDGDQSSGIPLALVRSLNFMIKSYALLYNFNLKFLLNIFKFLAISLLAFFI